MCLVGLIKRYGAVAATSVTTVRKILTIIMSFVLYDRPMSYKYVLAVLVFAGGIGTKLYFQANPRRTR